MSVPYIGAKISLTSRSLIRYEGILAAVDPKEATISLEKVRMMGTEGRRPGQEIAPSNDVYDAVVFRSGDIEDLQIFEAPAVMAPPKPSFVDPAIVTAKSSPSSSATAMTATTATAADRSTGGWPTAPRLQFGTASLVSGTAAAASPVPTQTPMFGSFSSVVTANGRPAMAESPSKTTRPTFGSFTSPANNNSAATSSSVAAAPANITKPHFSGQPLGGTSGSGLMTPSLLSKGRSMAGTGVDPSSGSSDKVVAYNTGTGKMELVERQSRSYASVVSDGAGRFRVTGEGAPKMVPKAEYDFEQANARLAKERLPEAPRGSFYDKGSSFFDNISCEATTGKDGRMDRNERRWNIETFGVPAAPGHHHNRYRGGSHQQYGGGPRHGGYGGQHTGGQRRSSNYQQRTQYHQGGSGAGHLHQHQVEN